MVGFGNIPVAMVVAVQSAQAAGFGGFRSLSGAKTESAESHSPLLKPYGTPISIPFPNEETLLGIGGIVYDAGEDVWTCSAESIKGSELDSEYPLAAIPRLYHMHLDFKEGTFDYVNENEPYVRIDPGNGLKVEDLDMVPMPVVGVDVNSSEKFFWVASEANSDLLTTSKYLSKDFGAPDLSTFDHATFSTSRLVRVSGITGQVLEEAVIPSFAQWDMVYDWDFNQCTGDRPFKGLHALTITTEEQHETKSMFVGIQAALYQDGQTPTHFSGSSTRILVYALNGASNSSTTLQNEPTASYLRSYRYDTSHLTLNYFQKAAGHFNALFGMLALSETSLLVLECEDFDGFGTRSIVNRIFYTELDSSATVDHCDSLNDCDISAAPKYLIWEQHGDMQLDAISFGPTIVDEETGEEMPTVALVFEDDFQAGAHFELYILDVEALKQRAAEGSDPYTNPDNTDEILTRRYSTVARCLAGVCFLFGLQLWLVRRESQEAEPNKVVVSEQNGGKSEGLKAPGASKFRYYLLGTSMMNSFLVGGVTFGFPGMALILRKEGCYAENCACGSFCAAEKEQLALVSTIGFFIAIGSRIFLGLLLDAQGPKVTAIVSCTICLAGTLLLATAQDLRNSFVWSWAMLSLGGSGVHIVGFHVTNLFKGNGKKTASASISAAFGASSAVFPIMQVINQYSDIGLQNMATAYSTVVSLVLINNFLVQPWSKVQPGIPVKCDIKFWRSGWWNKNFKRKPFLASVFNETTKFEFWGECLFYSANLLLLTYYLSTAAQLMFEKGDVKFTTEPNNWADYMYARLSGWFNSLGFLWFPLVQLIMKKSQWPGCFAFVCVANIIVVSIVMIPILEVQIVAMVILSLSRLALFSYHHAYIIEKFGMEYFGTLNGISSLIAAIIGLFNYPLQLLALKPGFAISFIPIAILVILSGLFPFLLSRKPVKNWAESYAVDPRKFRRPENVEELITLVKSETKIRCAGAMHSCAPLIESEGVIVSLANINKILEIDVERKIAKVQAGVVIHELCDAIKPYGLALGTLGTIDWQTVVGAVMTGTHGGSLSTPSLHAFAESYTFITSQGETKKVTRQNDPDLFSAMAPSMGVFGIVIEMEMRLVPLECLAARMVSMSFDDLIPQFQDIMRANKYARVVVYPSLNEATVWTAEPVEPGSAVADGATKSTGYINFRDENEKALLQQFLWDTKHGRYEKADNDLRKVLTSQLKRLRYYEGQYNHVLCKERNHGIPHADMEFGFDFNKGPEVLQAVKGYCDQNRTPYYNFEIRTTMRDEAMLSCCYERDTMWIDFQAKADVSGEYFGAMEDLLEPHGYRKHWAKGMDHTNPDYIVSQYPKLNKFIDMMAKHDPMGKFRNKHTDLWFNQIDRSIKRTMEMDMEQKSQSGIQN